MPLPPESACPVDASPEQPQIAWPGEIISLGLTLPGPADNLALDEALLITVNQEPAAASLRLWESRQYAVIVGRSNEIEKEVDVAACETDGVPILRRCSGGGTVVIGPGCLMFSLFLPLAPEAQAAGIGAVTCSVLGRIVQGLRTFAPDTRVCGTSDLAVGELKFSGNSQRWLKNALLHHGTILYDFDLARVGRYLKQPTRQPDYRQARPHDRFVMNFPATRGQLSDAIVAAWNAQPEDEFVPPYDLTAELARTKYATDEWNRQR